MLLQNLFIFWHLSSTLLSARVELPSAIILAVHCRFKILKMFLFHPLSDLLLLPIAFILDLSSYSLCPFGTVSIFWSSIVTVVSSFTNSPYNLLCFKYKNADFFSQSTQTKTLLVRLLFVLPKAFPSFLQYPSIYCSSFTLLHFFKCIVLGFSTAIFLACWT